MIRLIRFTLPRLAVLLLLPLLSGCNILGFAAQALPPPTIAPAYKGLEGQTCAVMVWADPGIRIDFASIQIDVAAALQKKLTSADPKEKKFITGNWPLRPESIVRYQQNNPQLENFPITDVAVKLGVGRVIYVEVHELATRSEDSSQLYKGNIAGAVKVIEVKDGKGKIAYEESDITGTFPTKGPPEGTTNSNDYQIYIGTLDQFTTALANRFREHEQPEERGR